MADKSINIIYDRIAITHDTIPNNCSEDVAIEKMRGLAGFDQLVAWMPEEMSMSLVSRLRRAKLKYDQMRVVKTYGELIAEVLEEWLTQDDRYSSHSISYDNIDGITYVSLSAVRA